MARTSIDKVKEILDNCTLDDTIVDVFVNTANLLVTEILGDDTTLPAALLAEIERWFAAHMIASTLWRTTKQEKVGDASVQYTGEFKENLSSTPYGQMVMQLDITGKMANLGKRAASIYAVTSFE